MQLRFFSTDFGFQATGADIGNDLLYEIDNVIGGGAGDTINGNQFANALSGRGGNDTLSGSIGADRLDGGTGADRMTGGIDSDTYVVDNAGDVVDELADGGDGAADLVFSSVSFSLADTVHVKGTVENLTLTGAGNISGSGTGGANAITGNGGANTIKGGGGIDAIDGGAGNDLLYGHTGNDSLKGGAGLDKFVFSTALGSTNVDKILDFNVASDTVYLARSIFTRAGANGTLSTAAFHKGTSAADASDRIVYDQAAGKIYYDPDGTGAASKVLFATVTPGTALTNADFHIFG